jgi:hypothetical protein
LLFDGAVVQSWTISGLKSSTDIIPYPVQGVLWEATATAAAVEGSVVPIVSNLNARASSGQAYRVLFQVGTPQGIRPAALAPCETTSGKVYFDVTGDKPDTVFYNAGGPDLVAWVPPRPQAEAPRAAAQAGPAPASPTGNAETAAAGGGATAPAASVAGTPTAQGAPPPAGWQGTPLPAGRGGTVLAAPVPSAAPPSATPSGDRVAAEPRPDPGLAGRQGIPAAADPPPPAAEGTPLVAVYEGALSDGRQGSALPVLTAPAPGGVTLAPVAGPGTGVPSGPAQPTIGSERDEPLLNVAEKPAPQTAPTTVVLAPNP